MCYSGCRYEFRHSGECSIPGGRKPPGADCLAEEDEQEKEAEAEIRAYRAMRMPSLRKPNYLLSSTKEQVVYHKGEKKQC